MDKMELLERCRIVCSSVILNLIHVLWHIHLNQKRDQLGHFFFLLRISHFKSASKISFANKLGK